MPDRWVAAVAISAALGALRPCSLPLGVVVLVVAMSVVVRRPWALCLGVAVLVSVLAGRALAGLDDPIVGPVSGEATLLSDPVPSYGGVRADVRLSGRRFELRADGASATALRPRLAGERVTVRGDAQAVPPGMPWLTARHVAGRLRVYSVESWRWGGTLSRAANSLRRTLAIGAATLPPAQRSLYTGIVLGDDREQPVALTDDFRGAGLTHLLAVSGQNVAFVLAVAAPILRRLRLWPRLWVTLGVIGMFGLMTRFEPSVLRAAAMAGLAATLATVGGPVSRVRVLAFAVTALLIVDPLLVRSVGFQLSTGATVAILLLAPRLAEVLPGPPAVRDAISVTLAAQLGVAPVLLATFGPVPVASLPANLLAVPAAGPVMMWGLTAGVAAGVVGGVGARLLHLPTRVLLVWVAEVARRTAALPLGEMGAMHLALLAGGLALAMWSGRSSPAWHGGRVGRAGIAIAVASLTVAVVQAQAPAPLRTELVRGVVRWHAGSSEVVVLGGVGGRSRLGSASTLAALRRARVGAIDLLVVADASIDATLVTAIQGRHPIGAIVVAGGAAGGVDGIRARVPVVIAPRPSAVLDVGALEVQVTVTAERLVVEARPGSAGERRDIAAVGSPP